MPRISNEVEDISEGDFLDSLDDDDFVFVIDGDGNLKSLLMPEMADEEAVPENVVSILKFFGIAKVDPATLH